MMKELKISCKVRVKRYRSYKGLVGKTAPNLLGRDFKTDKPRQKWATDITEFNIKGEKLYLSPIIDLYNGEIISYSTNSRPSYSMIHEMLNKAITSNSDVDGIILHSDQGWHYQMRQYCAWLSNHGIKQSMSRKGNCLDNAVIESFFGHMKSELFYTTDIKSIRQLKDELKKYINWYNNYRIKSKLNGLSPIEYRTKSNYVA